MHIIGMEKRIKNHRYTTILEHYRTFNNAYKQVVPHTEKPTNEETIQSHFNFNEWSKSLQQTIT